MTLGQRLIAERKKRGWSQTQLADKAGLRQPLVQRYEADKRRPQVPQMMALAKALGLTVEELDSDRPAMMSALMMTPEPIGRLAELEARVESLEASREEVLETLTQLRRVVSELRKRQTAPGAAKGPRRKRPEPS